MSISNQPTVTIDDEAALRQVPARTAVAWAKGDADAFAAVFTTGTNAVIAGTCHYGRDAVRSFIAGAFAGPFRGTRVVLNPGYLKHLGPDLALVVTEGGVQLPGQDEITPELAVRGTWVLARDGEQWLIEGYHSSTIVAA